MIEIRGLTKHYGEFCAVRELSLAVPPGQLFCFLGPNGAGKTTTIKMLTGLLRPTAGSALLCGIDIQKNPVEAKKKIGYVPDMPFLYDRLTPPEFLQFIGDLYSIPDQNVAEEIHASLALFDLLDHSASLIKDLSHGMRQRLIYAATFLHKPEVLFIDEPLIGLDPKTIRLIKDLLVQKTRAGMTIFLTTHILALAEDIADRIGIIMHGRMIALGTLQELRNTHGGVDLEDLFLTLTHTQPEQT